MIVEVFCGILMVMLIVLAAYCAGLHRQLSRAREPRKVLTRECQPASDVFLTPVVVLIGDRFTVLDNRGPDEQPATIRFGGCEAQRWDLAVNTETATARVCCWLDGCEIWKQEDSPVGAT